MSLTEDRLSRLLKLTANTAEHELTCEECGDRLCRYIEFRVSGVGPMPDDLKAIGQHLSVCPDCEEVVEAIIATLKAERGQLD
jgi:hypothetical protein